MKSAPYDFVSQESAHLMFAHLSVARAGPVNLIVRQLRDGFNPDAVGLQAPSRYEMCCEENLANRVVNLVLALGNWRCVMETMEQNIQLIYVSEATVAFEREDLHELLTKARRNNAALGITGVLLYVEGFFLQVLEGKQNVVLQLYEKIIQDSRHTRVSKLITEPIAERGFAEWEMGYANVGRTDLAQIEGLKDFFGGGSSLDALGAGRATTVITAFREGRWRRQIGV